MLFTFLDELFKVPRTYNLSHVNDDTDIISREESEKRIVWIIFIFGIFLNFGVSLVVFILFLLNVEAPKHEIMKHEANTSESTLPVLQQLGLILGDGTALFMYMDKSLAMKIIKTHKFNYDPFGFFIFHENDHFQTLVGTPGQLNYIHDLKFNSKKLFGKYSH